MKLPAAPDSKMSDFICRDTIVRLLPVLLTVVTLSTAQCSRGDHSNTPSAATAKCVSRVKSIPELSGIRMENDEAVAPSGSSLEGLQVALTITGSLRSVADPNADADDVCYTQNTLANLNKLIQALKDNGLPPTVDFINGRDFDPRVAQVWLESGNLVGNMSYDPHSAVRLSEDRFTEAVSKMDQTLEPLRLKSLQKTKYFRYPHLNPSKKQDIRQREEALITQEHYRIVPATITGYDQQFAWLYCSAQARGDQPCVNVIRADFFPLLLDSIDRARKLARQITGNPESKQILELRANQFTVDMLDEWIKRLKQLGVRFIQVDEALGDPLYSMTSKKGMAVTAGLVKRIARQQRGLSATAEADN